jgi:hypothetical protein
MKQLKNFMFGPAAQLFAVTLATVLSYGSLHAQGVTTASLNGIVSTDKGEALPGANVVVVHQPSGTRYGATTRANGQFNILNVKIGGPYVVTASILGYKKESQADIILSIGQDLKLNFRLIEQPIAGPEVVIIAKADKVLNAGRTGAATYIDRVEVTELPTLKRSTRDLTRLDPRSDGNFSFGGKNWLYNNISLDGSYFNNPFGLDDPAPGGQANAEPVPFDAVEQVQVSLAPFDVREGGFTGAGINTVTKSGTNQYKGSMYSFIRNQNLVGNTVKGAKVVANPDLKYNQSGFSVSGPIVPDKLFFFLNAEIERRTDPGTNFAAYRGTTGSGISRVKASVMDSIRNRLISAYGYDPGPYDGYTNETNNEKLILKLDWNISDNDKLSFRYNVLNAARDLPPHPFVLSYNGTGRGPNENSLPFRNSGYRINNKLNSFALEVNSQYEKLANRFFVSYNRFRDYRDPFSRPFPTIEIAQDGITYTTAGHEPFSVHNILDQDVLQLTDNFTYFLGSHSVTLGATFETFKFYNAFNLFKFGTFLGFLGTTESNPLFASPADFFLHTNPSDPTNFFNFNKVANDALKVPFKGEDISVGQLALYAQDSYALTERVNITYGLRVDFPMYFTQPVANPYSASLTLRNADGKPETIDQSKLPGTKALFSPRIGFNWDVHGDRTTQLRGGTGIFTGRVPFVWIGNLISNPGPNPNLPAYMQSFDINAAAPDFVWPQVWTTNIAVDQRLPWDLLGSLEILYGKDINAIYVRNANLAAPVRYLPDGRPYYGGNTLNAGKGFFGGVYVIDNTSEGYNYTITAQLRKLFASGLNTSLAYTYLMAKNTLKSTEIASVLWAENPVKGDPNKAELGFSEFGMRNRFTASATYRYRWSDLLATSIGLFVEVAEGNRFGGAGGNRYSFLYSGDVNGDANAGNDLIYIPRNQSEITFAPYTDASGRTVTADQQWAAFNAFIEQDDYLKANRGKIADRFGALNPWFSNIDLRLMQDFNLGTGDRPHTIQLSIDILNLGNLLNSEWGVRSVANAAATAPLQLVDFAGPSQAPRFNFKGTAKSTFTDDPGLFSRWQMQIGLRYMFN